MVSNETLFMVKFSGGERNWRNKETHLAVPLVRLTRDKYRAVEQDGTISLRGGARGSGVTACKREVIRGPSCSMVPP